MNPNSSPKKPALTVSQIREFVEQNDDFGFEMKVAAEIRKTLSVDVFHGATYADPITAKPRQFDLRFRVRDDRKTLYFAVECKNISLASPVVICGRPAEQKENFHDIIVSQGSGRLVSGSIQKAAGCLYRSGEFVGKSVLKPDLKGENWGRSNDTEIYDRWSQALASAHDLVREAAGLPSRRETCNFGAVFPWLVVPDGAIWTVSYDDQGKMTADPQPANYCRYFVGHHHIVEGMNDKVCLSHIDFLTFTGLQRKLGALRSIASDWDDWIPQNIRASYIGG